MHCAPKKTYTKKEEKTFNLVTQDICTLTIPYRAGDQNGEGGVARVPEVQDRPTDLWPSAIHTSAASARPTDRDLWSSRVRKIGTEQATSI